MPTATTTNSLPAVLLNRYPVFDSAGNKLADDPKWLIKLRFERYIGVRLLAEEWCQRAAA